MLGLTTFADGAAAQSIEPKAPPSEHPDSTPAWMARVPLPIEPRLLTAELSVLCGDKPVGLAWIDRMQLGLYRRMCLTSASFDGFFGNARFDDEYEATHGSLSAGTLWDERDNWDPSVRFRVHLRLPQLNERFSAFVGRLDPDEYVTEARDDFDSLPRQFARAEDDDVLLGLGYRKPGPGGGYFDASVGARLDWPPQAYVKGAYRFTQPFFKRNLLRLDETIFWRDRDGFGATSRIYLDRLLSEDFLVRWAGSGTYSEETDGVRWVSSLTLYQSLGVRRALAYQAAITGETDDEVDIGDYGLRVMYRRSIYRDWLILELRSSLTWPRETLEEDRESNLGAGVALEMQFGERTRR
ncbi:MAG TPA: hypothetical protein VFI92_09630 [Steroidobacteraceae bacterium]|nr:hypothetical protein [Steroidobacteraceae bacterium]